MIITPLNVIWNGTLPQSMKLCIKITSELLHINSTLAELDVCKYLLFAYLISVHYLLVFPYGRLYSEIRFGFSKDELFSVTLLYKFSEINFKKFSRTKKGRRETNPKLPGSNPGVTFIHLFLKYIFFM